MNSLPLVPVLANRRQLEKIQLLLHGKVAVGPYSEWLDFIDRAVASGWGIAWEERISTVGLRTMRAAMHHIPRIPILLITEGSAENLIKLKDIVVAEVMITSDVPRKLSAALLTVRSSAALNRAAAIIEAADNLPLETRTLLAFPLRSRVPVRSLATWARAMGRRNESSLWRRWQATPLASAGVTPKDYLDWIDLVRCASCKSPWITWRAAAVLIGMRPERLVRVCTRLMRRTPSQIGAARILEGWGKQIAPFLGSRAQQNSN